ncbi:MAG: glycosyltransferase family 4 protein [Magnetococcales bacterium]|nr:glycosyltransferase family 4 protein [Magnetococcales bacterium]
MKPTVTICYHFYPPDDVVSARLFADLAEGLVCRGWSVRMLTGNRWFHHTEGSICPSREQMEGVEVVRSWRPNWDQSRHLWRMLNGLWLMAAWWLRVLFSRRPDVLILGSDPQFTQLLIPFLRLISPRTRIVQWVFDLYPEAIMAHSPGSGMARLAERLRAPVGLCYRFADGLVDIGACMRERLSPYQRKSEPVTLTPWALVEPQHAPAPDPELRNKLYGPGVKLVLLYSGHLSRAHEYRPFLALARRLREREPGILFAFSQNGHRIEELREALEEADHNIRFTPFLPLEQLAGLLASADIHLASLRSDWWGTVVPSKFFGSMATGRPVLFCGAEKSAIRGWIDEYKVGYFLNEEQLDETADLLVDLAGRPEKLRALQQNAFEVYGRHFSRRLVLNGWDAYLRELLERS